MADTASLLREGTQHVLQSDTNISMCFAMQQTASVVRSNQLDGIYLPVRLTSESRGTYPIEYLAAREHAGS